MKRAALLLCLAACGSSPPSIVGAGPTLAVVNSDHKDTNVALIDIPTQMVIKTDCLTATSGEGYIATPLSGDVVLPSQPQANHEVLLIDRTNSTLTYLDPNLCVPRLQFSVGSTFMADPHDVASISATKSYVTRYRKNPKSTGKNDQGDDILIVNPQSGNITGRIDLTSYATSAAVDAHPDRIWVVGSTAYVTLRELSDDESITGTGRILAINTATNAVSATVNLTNRQGCSQLVGDTNSLAVVCAGGGSTTSSTALSGLDIYTLGGVAPVHAGAMEVSAVESRTLVGTLLASLGSQTYLVGTLGDFSGNPADAMWTYNVATQQAVALGSTPGSFELGDAVYDANSQTLFMSQNDTTTPSIRVFAVADGVPTEAMAIPSGTHGGLPPLAVGSL